MLRNLLLPRRERSVDHLPVQDVETGPLLHLSRAASGTNHSSANAEANTESNTSMSHSTTVTSTVTYGALDEYDYENNSRSSLADDQVKKFLSLLNGEDSSLLNGLFILLF